MNDEVLVIGNKEMKYSIDNKEQCLRLDQFDVQSFNTKIISQIRLEEIKNPK